MPTLTAGMHGDGLRVQVSAVDVRHLAVVGTIRGVTPLAAAGKNGVGTGLLRSVAGSVAGFQWQAPGGSYGPITFAFVTGDYVLEDGTDPGKWIRVHVDLTWLPTAAEEAQVYLKDRFNELGPDDVSSANAAAGIVETVTLSLLNASPDRVKNVKAWLGASAAGLAISPDNVTFTSPTTEGAAISIGTIEKGASASLYFRRTITAGASPAASILNQLELSWDGL
jgi:hypothetical protein